MLCPVPDLTTRLSRIALLAAWCACFAPACGPDCDRNPDEPPVEYTEGTTTDGVYESAPPEGPFLHFPSGRTYRLAHGLGQVPTACSSYLAHDEYPASFAEGAGNQVTFEAWTAAHVDIRNDTCSDVRLRVVCR